MTPPIESTTAELAPAWLDSPDPFVSTRPRSRLSVLRKYGKILRVSLIERMTYRADFLFTTFLRFLPMLTTILLWQAIYAGARTTSGQTEGQTVLSGFSYHQMIAYLLLVNISRMFSSMPRLASGISLDIREGTLKKYLIQPIDMIAYLVTYRMAHKITYIISAALPYGVLFYLCRGYFEGLVPNDPWVWAGYATSLILAFFVGFFFETSVGMVGFWFLEVTSLLWIVMTLNFFISGHMLPLDLLPHPWDWFLKELPFQYMAYYPAVIFLGKVQGWALVFGLLKQAAWALFFALLARWLYRRGLRRYSAFGG